MSNHQKCRGCGGEFFGGQTSQTSTLCAACAGADLDTPVPNPTAPCSATKGLDDAKQMRQILELWLEWAKANATAAGR